MSSYRRYSLAGPASGLHSPVFGETDINSALAMLRLRRRETVDRHVENMRIAENVVSPGDLPPFLPPAEFARPGPTSSWTQPTTLNFAVSGRAADSYIGRPRRP